jgi:drug/metabolite transporter (DMT)-like permease
MIRFGLKIFNISLALADKALLIMGCKVILLAFNPCFNFSANYNLSNRDDFLNINSAIFQHAAGNLFLYFCRPRKKMNNSNIKAHLALFGANLIYGMNYTIAKDVMPAYIGPSGFVLIRASGALILFWLTGFFSKNEKIDKKDAFRFFLCGLFGVAVNQLLFFEGLSLTTPINAGIIMVTTPILVLIISSILIKERITSNKIGGIAIGVAGALLLIIGADTVATGNVKGNPLGDFFIFLNATSYAVFLAMVKPLMEKYPTITVIKRVFMWGLIFIFPFGIEQAIAVEWNAIPLLVWFEIAFVVFCTTFLAYLLNIYALKAVTPTVSAIYIYLQPVLAAMIALMAGKDELSIIKIASALLIFTGVYLVSMKKNKRVLPDPEKN